MKNTKEDQILKRTQDLLHKEQTSESLLHMGHHMQLMAIVGPHHQICTVIVSVLQLLHIQQKKVNIYQFHSAMIIVRRKVSQTLCWSRLLQSQASQPW